MYLNLKLMLIPEYSHAIFLSDNSRFLSRIKAWNVEEGKRSIECITRFEHEQNYICFTIGTKRHFVKKITNAITIYFWNDIVLAIYYQFLRTPQYPQPCVSLNMPERTSISQTFKANSEFTQERARLTSSGSNKRCSASARDGTSPRYGSASRANCRSRADRRRGWRSCRDTQRTRSTNGQPIICPGDDGGRSGSPGGQHGDNGSRAADHRISILYSPLRNCKQFITYCL